MGWRRYQPSGEAAPVLEWDPARFSSPAQYRRIASLLRRMPAEKARRFASDHGLRFAEGGGGGGT